VGVLANITMKLRVPQKAANFLTSRVTVSFSRRTPLHGGRSIVRFLTVLVYVTSCL
jgi:hypothetical protein